MSNGWAIGGSVVVVLLIITALVVFFTNIACPHYGFKCVSATVAPTMAPTSVQASVTVPPTLSPTTFFFAGTNGSLNASCPAGQTLSFTQAHFGKASGTDVSCATDVTAYMNARCQGKNACNLTNLGAAAFGGDPCPSNQTAAKTTSGYYGCIGY